MFAHVSYFRHFISTFLIGIGIACIGYGIFDENSESGYRTLWIVDSSLSMAVEDIRSSGQNPRISRLSLAKNLMLSGVESIPGEHAIISYARDARLETPFNTERNHLSDIINSISYIEFFGGSDLMSAIELFTNTYRFSDIPTRIIILTDGGSTQSGQFLTIPGRYSGYIFSLGTLGGGNIPLGYNALGEMRYKYSSGGVIIAAYNPEYIDLLKDEYDFLAFHFEKKGVFPSVVKQAPVKNNTSLFLFLGSLSILVGYFFPLHVKKR